VPVDVAAALLVDQVDPRSGAVAGESLEIVFNMDGLFILDASTERVIV